jgi:transposase-like protein
MSIDLTDPIFNDEAAAWKHFEAIRWPHGPVCPHCGVVNAADPIVGKTARHGLYRCHECVKQFTATIGTVYERSHIPMHKWLLATHLMCASKKGISAHQLFRSLGFGSYRTAWFMAHRIREAMTDRDPGPMGGEGKTVEVDETYIGRLKDVPKPKGGSSHKNVVLTLVERGGSARSFHVDSVSVADMKPIIHANIARESAMMTDQAAAYPEIAKDFASHDVVNHAREEYVRREGDKLISTNIVEGYYSIFKRGMKGVYQHCSEKHLHRYLREFDFRYSNRSALGVEDTERAELALKGVEGKRLTYRQPRKVA